MNCQSIEFPHAIRKICIEADYIRKQLRIERRYLFDEKGFHFPHLCSAPEDLGHYKSPYQLPNGTFGMATVLNSVLRRGLAIKEDEDYPRDSGGVELPKSTPKHVNQARRLINTPSQDMHEQESKKSHAKSSRSFEDNTPSQYKYHETPWALKRDTEKQLHKMVGEMYNLGYLVEVQDDTDYSMPCFKVTNPRKSCYRTQGEVHNWEAYFQYHNSPDRLRLDEIIRGPTQQPIKEVILEIDSMVSNIHRNTLVDEYEGYRTHGICDAIERYLRNRFHPALIDRFHDRIEVLKKRDYLTINTYGYLITYKMEALGMFRDLIPNDMGPLILTKTESLLEKQRTMVAVNDMRNSARITNHYNLTFYQPANGPKFANRLVRHEKVKNKHLGIWKSTHQKVPQKPDKKPRVQSWYRRKPVNLFQRRL